MNQTSVNRKKDSDVGHTNISNNFKGQVVSKYDYDTDAVKYRDEQHYCKTRNAIAYKLI